MGAEHALQRDGEEEVVKRPALSAAVLVLVGSLVAAPPRASAQSSPLFRTGTQLVALNVTVTDRDRHFVRGLTAGDFTVLEDGVEQEVQFFDDTDVPLDLIVLLDTSSSMTHNMQLVRGAALGFLQTLRQGDRGAVVAFGDRVNVLQELTGDLRLLEAAVRGVEARGATALYDSIYIALRQFGQLAREAGEVRRQAIAVLTDGEDTSSLLVFDDVLQTARKSGVSIYPITLLAETTAARLAMMGARRDPSQARAEFSLRRLALDTGGQAFFSVRIEGLSGVYASIAEELSSQYSLAYVPADAQADGRYRQIQVRVASRPDLRLRTRTGYVLTPTRADSEPVSGRTVAMDVR